MRLDTPEKRQQYRSLIIPKDAVRDPRSTDRAEVYTYTNGRVCAKGFLGTAAHPTWHHSFRTEAQREQFIAEFFASQAAHHEMMQARKAARVSYRHTLEVGDIVHTSWGYDQTNVSFYEVTRIVSDKSVAVRPIKADTIETGFMCGDTTPQPGQYCGDEKIHRVREGNIIVNVEHGHYDGYPSGTATQHCSWYA